jgi:heme/copper-type cytochrome/quinol oxidase subunit 2
MAIRSTLFWVAAACCILAELAILRSLLFGRARAAEQRQTDRAIGIARTSRPAEIAWALLPAIGLMLVLYLTWRAVDARPVTVPSDVGRIGAIIGG